MAKKAAEKAKTGSKPGKKAKAADKSARAVTLDAENKELKRKLNKLRKKLKGMKPAAPEPAPAPAKAPPAVSPLAPAGGFPSIPPIEGLRLSAVAAGVKYAGRDDVMLAELPEGSTLAGVFTKSSTRSAPVRDCQAKLDALAPGSEGGFAILVNAGNSNAFTGAAGERTVAEVAAAVSRTLAVPAGHVFTASTGVIGEPLPADRITGAMIALRDGLAPDRFGDAARAIMTTDTFPKGASAEIEVEGVPVRIAGLAKGSGMIAPDMATMLAYVFTDAAVTQSALKAMLRAAAMRSFNAITVDSDTSTSDTLMVAATGMAGNRPITSARTAGGQAFAAALEAVLRDLRCRSCATARGPRNWSRCG